MMKIKSSSPLPLLREERARKCEPLGEGNKVGAFMKEAGPEKKTLSPIGGEAG
jgi:hypothetical protein